MSSLPSYDELESPSSKNCGSAAAASVEMETKSYQLQEAQPSQKHSRAFNFSTEETKSKDKEETKSKDKQAQQQAQLPYHLRIARLDETELGQFLNQVLPPGVLLQLIIHRNKSGVTNTLYPTYYCYYEATGTHLMTGTTKSSLASSHSEIYMKQPFGTDAKWGKKLGDVRGNFTGLAYTVYDDGMNPKKLKELNQAPAKEVREELCSIQFNNNFLASCPRSFTLAIPRVQLDEATGIVKQTVWKPLSQTASMMERFRHSEQCKLVDNAMHVLKNKPPVWSERLEGFALNFNGRAKITSQKNFQVIDPQDPKYIILQFGKMGTDIFTVDVQFPLSPLQAFGIALASLGNL